jgi:hypothetical protein
MTTPHQWAAEIHAMADGIEIEGNYNKYGDTHWNPATNDYNPLTHPFHQWRIVPEKKVLRYRVALKQNRLGEKWLSFVTTEEEAGILEHVIAFVEWLGDWQEVEI